MNLKEISVVIVGKLSDRLMEKVESTFTAYRLWELTDTDAFWAEKANDIQALVTSGNPVMGASRALMEKCPNLKIIASNGVGYDSIDVAAANELGIIVTNTPGVLNDCVADIGMALLLNVARRVNIADRYVREGRWPTEGRFPMATKVSGKRCGIVGLGNIGHAVARRAAAFEMDIHYYDPKPHNKPEWTAHNTLISLAEAVDFLVLTLPGGAKTRGLIDKEILHALGKNGYLISISRGSVVNETDLIHALENNVIAGAALDVYAHEPNVPEALIKLDNVVLTPHIASGTSETFNAMADLVFANLHAFFTGKPVITQVK